MILFLISLPRGLLLGSMLLMALGVFAHFLALGEFGEAGKAVGMAGLLGFLLYLRLGGGRAK